MTIAPLEPLVGTWDIQAFDTPGRMTIEPDLDGTVLVQRSEVEHPAAPTAMSVISAAGAPEGQWLQHYFDSRGVCRVYAMTFDGTTWTLVRETHDFSDLRFDQRFVGTLSEDGSRIDGHWDMRHPGGDWEPDFALGYSRAL